MVSCCNAMHLETSSTTLVRFKHWEILQKKKKKNLYRNQGWRRLIGAKSHTGYEVTARLLFTKSSLLPSGIPKGLLDLESHKATKSKAKP